MGVYQDQYGTWRNDYGEEIAPPEYQEQDGTWRDRNGEPVPIYQNEYGTWTNEYGDEVAPPAYPGASGVEICSTVADIPMGPELGLQHQWVRTPEAEAGMGPAAGGDPNSSGIITQTTMNDHTGRGDAAGSTCVPVEEAYPGWYGSADCVDGQLEVGRSTGDWGLGNTCQDVVVDVVDTCDPGYNGPEGGMSYDTGTEFEPASSPY
jgi:hypothetical protein